MIAPEIPADEKQRLEKLRALKILDSAPEERFDRLTRMAKRMFDVDVSVVSLIDENRQWFKSKAEDSELPSETSRDISFCGHAILGEQVFVVEDALQDDRFYDNPLVISENDAVDVFCGPAADDTPGNIGRHRFRVPFQDISIASPARSGDTDEIPIMKYCTHLLGRNQLHFHTRCLRHAQQIKFIARGYGVPVYGCLLALAAHDSNGGPDVGRITAEQTRVGGKPAGQAKCLDVEARCVVHPYTVGHPGASLVLPGSCVIRGEVGVFGQIRIKGFLMFDIHRVTTPHPPE